MPATQYFDELCQCKGPGVIFLLISAKSNRFLSNFLTQTQHPAFFITKKLFTFFHMNFSLSLCRLRPKLYFTNLWSLGLSSFRAVISCSNHVKLFINFYQLLLFFLSILTSPSPAPFVVNPFILEQMFSLLRQLLFVKRSSTSSQLFLLLVK